MDATKNLLSGDQNKAVEKGLVQMDLFALTGETPPAPVEKPKKEKSNACSANKTGARKNVSAASKKEEKEPPKDKVRLVVLQNNEQFTYPANMTLEEIRVELAKDYPMYTQKNTKWYWEVQEDLNRVLCIPASSFNKAG